MEKKQDMYFQRIYSFDNRLLAFTEECNRRGIVNNSSIDAIQFHKYDNSAFFAGIQDEKIKVFSGVHEFFIFEKKYWRIGFRGVSLYDNNFKPCFSKNYRLASLNMGVLIYFQMQWVEKNFGLSNFVITSNSLEKSKPSGKSHEVDRMSKSGLFSGMKLLYEDVTYAYTVQNIWLLDKQQWYNDFKKYYENKIIIKDLD
jgi:hypothetical protein